MYDGKKRSYLPSLHLPGQANNKSIRQRFEIGPNLTITPERRH